MPTVASCLRDVRVSSRTRRARDFEDGGQISATMAILKQGSDTRWKSQHLLGRFDQEHRQYTPWGRTESLGRYATHEFGAKAAAVYSAKHQASK